MSPSHWLSLPGEQCGVVQFISADITSFSGKHFVVSPFWADKRLVKMCAEQRQKAGLIDQNVVRDTMTTDTKKGPLTIKKVYPKTIRSQLYNG